MDISISEQIRKVQKNKKITQKDIAIYLGITSVGFQKMLSKNSFKVSTLIQIAEKLDVPIEYFFSNKSINEYVNIENEYKELEISNKELKERLNDKIELTKFYKEKVERITDTLEGLLVSIDFQIKTANLKKISNEELKQNIKNLPDYIDIKKMTGLEKVP